MNGQNAVELMSKASVMLAEANTIQEARDLKDLALTAADWAKRKGLGAEAVQYARSYALAAERKMGEMLALTERAKGAKGIGPVIAVTPRNHNAPPTLAALGLTKRESAQAQKLAALPEETFAKIQSADISRIEAFRMPAPAPHVTHNAGCNEWYTPAEYIAAAVTVMGGIDLDPASTAEANAVVKAAKFYTAEQDGLLQEWHGRVWLNPPYAQPLVDQFSERLTREWRAQRISQAVALTNNATETVWFQRLLVECAAVCFPRGRVRFWEPDGKVSAPLQGQAVLYFGTKAKTFGEAFSPFGACLLS